MKTILNIIKKIVLAPFILYIYNLIASPLNLLIPINVFTIIVVGILGIPGLITLLIFLLAIY